MKKIIVFSPSNVGTIASCTANIIRALYNISNVEVYPIILYKENGGYDVFEHSRVIIDNTKSKQKKLSLLRKLRIYKTFKQEIKPDITISTLVSVTTLNILSGGKDKKIGVFHAPLAQTKNVSRLNYLLCLFSYKFLFRKLDRLYAVSETTKKDVETYIGKKATVVYNIHNFDNISSKSLEALSEDEMNIFKKPSILYVGHLYDTKGVKRLLKAFSRISIDANLIIVGGASDNNVPQHYINYSNELGIDTKTFFLGFKINPYKYMKNCTVFCLPSYSEGLPGVLIEALSLNKKVITTNSSIGNWEIMQCYNEFLKGISVPFENDLGIITSNDDKNDECVTQLTESMNKLLLEHNNGVLPFDITRFEGKYLVNYYTNI